jgi:hypothetical protein
VTEVLPLLYLHGLFSKDFVPALEGGWHGHRRILLVLLGVPVGRRIALRRSEEFTCGSQAGH